MLRTRAHLLLFVLAVLFIGASLRPPLFAEEASRTIQGEIVDPAAYLREGRHGAEVTDQTYEAVDGGQTLAILEEGTGTLYLLLAEGPGEDPSSLVYDYANQSVKVTGTVFDRGGLKGMIAKSVEPLKTPEGSAEPTKPATPSASSTPVKP